jgi:hypothetical protein
VGFLADEIVEVGKSARDGAEIKAEQDQSGCLSEFMTGQFHGVPFANLLQFRTPRSTPASENF